jgi:hypothetical protein
LATLAILATQKQETFAGADQDGCNPRPSPAENSDADLARKVLNFDGHSGQSGQSFSNQELIYSHWENADGHNGKSLSNQQPAGLKGTGERAGPGFATTADASVSDPTIWSDLYKERAAIRQFDGGYPRDEAELLAWREVETRWHMAHGERVPRDLCAGCGHPIGEAEALDVIDGNRVHDCADNGCLIRHVERWRRAATRALVALGLRPPRADERRA